MKKRMKKRRLKVFDNFKTKIDNEENVIIEGFANKFTVDRGLELVDAKAWKLDNFKKNPVILFNHGFDIMGGLPIGNSLDIAESEEGLKIKVKISNSKTELLTMIRDLVKERMLKSFSVGFEEIQSKTVTIDGKDVKLITEAELLEVSIVGIPMNQDSTFNLSEKSLKSTNFLDLKSKYLKAKGAKVAYNIEAILSNKNRDEIIKKVAAATKVEINDIYDMLSGDKEFADNVIKAFKKEVDNEENEQKPKEKDDKKPKDEVDEENESEEGEEEEENESEDKDSEAFKDCIINTIPKLIDDGLEPDIAVAKAIKDCSEKTKCTLSDQGKVTVFEKCINELEKNEPQNFSIELNDDIIDMNKKDTVPLESGNNETDFGNPMIEQQKQTNILLGALVQEFRTLSDKLVKVETNEDEEEKLKAISLRLKNLGF